MPRLTIIIIISGIIPTLPNELNKMLCGQVMQNGREYEVERVDDHLISSMSGILTDQEKLVLLVKIANV